MRNHTFSLRSLLRGTWARARQPVLAAGLVALASSVSPSSFSAAPIAEGDGLVFPVTGQLITLPVDQGPLALEVTLRGQMEAVDNVTVASECYRTVQIIDMVPEGSWVEKGDVVARLDTSEIEERIRRERLDVIESKNRYDAAAEEIELQRMKNESRLAAAKLAVRLAELDLETYRDAQFPQLLRSRQNEVSLAEEAMVRQEKSFEYVADMVSKGYRPAAEIDEARGKLNRAKHDYRTAADGLRVLSQHERVRELTSLSALAQNARDELERVIFANRSSMLSREIAVTSARKRYERNAEYLDKLNTAFAACTLRAPRAGRVVHARESSYRSAESLEPGDYVRERQAVVEIPQFEKMRVALRVHESQVRHVAEGQRVSITAEAMPGRTFSGTVTEVAAVPVTGDWPNYDLKQYPAEVLIDADTFGPDELRPGLTAMATIHVDERTACAQVPVQAIVPIDSEADGEGATRMTVFVRKGDRVEVREVRTGLATPAMVEVTDGLEPGEEIVLSPRTELSDELTALYKES